MKHQQKNLSGFTLIELIVVLTVVGVISIYAASRFATTSVFDEVGFFEESLSAVRYAQKLAIASGCDIRVTFDDTGATLGFIGFTLRRWQNTGNNTCDAGDPSLVNVARPGGSDFSSTPPNGVAVGNADYYYDQIGIPRTLPPIPPGGVEITMETTVTIGTRTLSIAPYTGFVRCTIGC